MKPFRAERGGRRTGTRKRPKPKSETKLSISRAAVCIVVIAASALALVWPHLEMVKIGYEVARLEKEWDVLTQERRVLRVEIAALRQLDRIEMIARSKLGMVFPGPDQIVYVKVPPKDTH
jgi:cell division protein FtsL